MWFVGFLFSALFAWFGRWLLLHPEKVVPKGHFTGEHTFGALLFRAQIKLIGYLAVFFGAWCAVFSLGSIFIFISEWMGIVAQIAGCTAAILVVAFVRKDVRAKPRYESTSPYGWWP